MNPERHRSPTAQDGSADDDVGRGDPIIRELRAKLDRQKRMRAVKPSPSTTPRDPAGAAITYRRDLPHPASGVVVPGTPSEKRPIESCVVGAEVRHPAAGAGFVIADRLDGLGNAESLNRAFKDDLASPASGLRTRLARVCALEDLRPTDFLFLDLETAGLTTNPVFLIGTMVWEDGFVVRQYLARHYAEEAAIIALCLDAHADKRILVSFNGKSFDLPFLKARAAVNGIPFDLDFIHFDLLHECRRIWRDVLPDCRLQTLERRVCHRSRTGDIPGQDIPDAYHAYVRTDHASQMVDIIKHNRMDLVTLADLMTRMPSGAGPADSRPEAGPQT